MSRGQYDKEINADTILNKVLTECSNTVRASNSANTEKAESNKIRNLSRGYYNKQTQGDTLHYNDLGNLSRGKLVSNFAKQKVQNLGNLSRGKIDIKYPEREVKN